MSKTSLTAILVLGVAACSPASGKNAEGGGASASRTLVEGTRIEATTGDALSSRHNEAGETLAATVSADVEDGSGHVVIPAGSAVALRIVQLEPATNKSQDDGKIALEATAVTVRGQVYSMSARLDPVTHQLHGRGVTAGEAEKVGAGAAIGGAIGAGGGTAVAVHWASRDVVVPVGTHVAFSLPQSFTISTR